ncbi:hypothetical protein OG785_03385 [Streptomyces sp. NBC_00006]|uniref:bestrophin-like domain n=1 Tax=unclassified Streptomyces TaxID=2593676 RepID=UPI0022557AB5|nr:MULTISPECIES: hypothetical protein [unclassified Streptomyces]MCX4834562.1 hypothetical protein [Streptomyces sp. NBC_01016]MCX5529615.1 hypothetical protein [Streptomyces sp. NBC_00006]
MYLYGVLVACGAFVLGATAAWLWTRHVDRRWPIQSGPVVAASCGAVASLYVLTIAFLIVNTSASLGNARAGAVAESGALRDAYLVAQRYPAAERRELQASLRTYTDTVIDVEWPRLARGEDSPAAWNQLDALHNRILASHDAPALAQADLRTALHEVYVQRRLRVAAADDGIPPVLLGFLISTAVLVPLYFLLMGWPTGVRARAGLGTTAALFAAGIWIVLQLNHPFASGIRVTSDSFKDALARMEQVDSRDVPAASLPRS